MNMNDEKVMFSFFDFLSKGKMLFTQVFYFFAGGYR